MRPGALGRHLVIVKRAIHILEGRRGNRVQTAAAAPRSRADTSGPFSPLSVPRVKSSSRPSGLQKEPGWGRGTHHLLSFGSGILGWQSRAGRWLEIPEQTKRAACALQNSAGPA